MNRQSNTYTLTYAIALVVIVGLALSVIYQALRPTQVENIENDTKKQILAAALIVPGKGESVADLYAGHITESYIVNSEGEKIDSDVNPFYVKVAEEVKKPAQERLLPVFVCKLNGESADSAANIKYIVPTYGAGLWGPIWGYVAMDSNGREIYGAYFAHQGETPGLGGEIEKPFFQKEFEGKDVVSADGSFQPVKIVKKPADKLLADEVQSLSGATITSQGVQKMLSNSLEPYTAFFNKLANEQAAQNVK